MVTKLLNAKNEGSICYRFKGMQMSKEQAKVIEETQQELIVKRDVDNQIIAFIKVGKRWLLKDHHKPDSLLVGTEFVYNENFQYS